MKRIGGLFAILFGLAVTSVVVWLLFWVANGVMWLSGIGGEALLSDLFLRDASTFGRVVIYLIGFESILLPCA